ncbi:MAG: type II secretion system F family protein, partial [Beijerinckiaceae bacterium]|nr:type II secretion system F family protein [Beijerinckiaceae bacterium]
HRKKSMFEGLNPTVILIAASVAAVVLVVAYPYLTSDPGVEKRKNAIASNRPGRLEPDSQRRKNVAESLKLLDQRQAKVRVTLEGKLAQAGLDWTKKHFFLFSAALGAASWFLILLFSMSLPLSLLGFVIGGLGLPNWYLSYRKKKRLANFIEAFPNALDIIIRGVKAGLPLSECLKIIANESPEPLGPEFKNIIEAQQMGMTLSDAVQRLAQRTPCAESNFFAIALGIQQKSGGNISETLANLARVLRERKKMKMKIKAMSTEATASAAIIACMPPGVGLMVYLSNPDYISLLWTTTTGQVTLLISGTWMLFGVLVMRKMISFEV